MSRAGAALAALGLVLAPGAASGHGRLPESKSLALDDSTLVVGTTFGLVVSTDGGAGWDWICDEAIGYLDTKLDPAIAVAPDGAWLVGTFDGVARSADGGCSWAFAGGAAAGHWVVAFALGGDGRIWAATGTSGRANDVLVSADGGATFVGTGLAAPDTDWRAVAVAPGDPARVYATGVRFEAGGAGGTVQVPLALRSDDAGGAWTPLGHAFAAGAQLRVLGVAADDADLLFVREDGDLDRLWRSADGGASFTDVLDLPENLTSFAQLPDGTFVAGSRLSGVFRSADGVAWTPDATPPRLACAAVGPDGLLYGCAADAADGFAVGRRDARTSAWTPVWRFRDLRGPLACPAGTPTSVRCPAAWPLVEDLLGLAADAGVPAADAAIEPPPGERGGCGGCSLGLAGVFVACPWAWPGRRRPRR